MRTVVAYILYYLGDLVSKPMHYFDWGWLYPIYNWLMIKSGDFDINHKIWGPMVDEHAEDYG